MEREERYPYSHYVLKLCLHQSLDQHSVRGQGVRGLNREGRYTEGRHHGHTHTLTNCIPRLQKTNKIPESKASASLVPRPRPPRREKGSANL